MEFNQILEKGRSSTKTISVCQAADREVIKAVHAALKDSKAKFILYGGQEEIESIVSEFDFSNFQDRYEIRHTKSMEQTVERSVRAVAKGTADILMKGLVPTPVILKEVLKKEHNLTTGRKLSHLAFFSVPTYHKTLMVTDAGMNIAPDLNEKVDIIKNAIDTACQIGYESPKVALLSAIEIINPKMQSTIDAALITQMSRRGQIKGAVIDGPFALDNAINKEAAIHKGLDSEVAGDADILVVPQIETGNALYKSLVFLGNAKVASIVTGAVVPIILSSRADKFSDKYHSIMLSLAIQ